MDEIMSLLEKEWYIQAPWGRICIIAWGNCFDPPVLLCHGLIDSAVSFRPLISLLPKNFYYIGMELPGHGRSDRLPPGLMLTTHDLLYSIEAVVKHFRWDTFTFIGHSFGAVLGKVYNIAYPGKMSKIIELDPINFTGIPPDAFSQWYKKYFTDYYDNYDKYNTPIEKGPVLKWNDVLATLIKNRGISEELAAATLGRLTEPAGDGLVRYTYDIRAKIIHGPPFSLDHIKKIFTAVKTPMLTIAAENSIKNKLFRNTTFLLDEAVYPAGNYRMRQVKGGHDVHVSHPDRLSTYVSQFMLYGLEGVDNKAKL